MEYLKYMQIFKNKDLFNIRSFIILFAIYSLISIWLAHSATRKDKTINSLVEEATILKSEYVGSKTILMHKTKRSNLLDKAESFAFYLPKKPITIIRKKYEN